jgi:hypothetical protein
MATTPNYGWVTPAPTDFVTDLPADFEVFADAVDASFAADEGDLLIGNSSDIFVPLPIGANGTLLTSDGTTASWVAPTPAGGETLIASGTLSGASVAVTSIPTTYKDLKLVIRNYLPDTDNTFFYFRFNQDSNANRHNGSTDSDGDGGTFNDTSAIFGWRNDDAVSQSLSIGYIYDYANTSTWKMFRTINVMNNATTATDFNRSRRIGLYNQTDAITSFSLIPAAGNFTSGDYLLYGVS